MAISARDLIKKDKQMPVDLSGQEGKALVVNATGGYDLTASDAVQAHPLILGGDATVAANVFTFLPCECWDSTRLVYLQTTEDKTVELPATAGAVQIKYHFYIVKLVADSSCEFRAYLNKIGADSPEADAEVSAWRYRTFGRTFTDGVAVNCILVGQDLIFAQASKCRSTVALALTYNTIDHSDLLDVDALAGIQYGVWQSAGSDYLVYSSLDGVNCEHRFLRSNGSNSDITENAWGYQLNGGQSGFIPFTTARKFRANSVTPKLLFKAVRLKLSF